MRVWRVGIITGLGLVLALGAGCEFRDRADRKVVVDEGLDPNVKEDGGRLAELIRKFGDKFSRDGLTRLLTEVTPTLKLVLGTDAIDVQALVDLAFSSDKDGDNIISSGDVIVLLETHVLSRPWFEAGELAIHRESLRAKILVDKRFLAVQPGFRVAMADAFFDIGLGAPTVLRDQLTVVGILASLLWRLDLEQDVALAGTDATALKKISSVATAVMVSHARFKVRQQYWSRALEEWEPRDGSVADRRAVQVITGLRVDSLDKRKRAGVHLPDWVARPVVGGQERYHWQDDPKLRRFVICEIYNKIAAGGDGDPKCDMNPLEALHVWTDLEWVRSIQAFGERRHVVETVALLVSLASQAPQPLGKVFPHGIRVFPRPGGSPEDALALEENLKKVLALAKVPTRTTDPGWDSGMLQFFFYLRVTDMFFELFDADKDGSLRDYEFSLGLQRGIGATPMEGDEATSYVFYSNGAKEFRPAQFMSAFMGVITPSRLK